MVSFLSEEGEVRTMSKAALQEQMQTSEKLLRSINESWEEKIQKTEEARCIISPNSSPPTASAGFIARLRS